MIDVDNLPLQNDAIAPAGWGLILAGLALGLALLIGGPVALGVPALITGILFPALPLFALAVSAGRGRTGLFRPLRLKDAFLIPAFAALAIILTLLAALAISDIAPTATNPIFAQIQSQDGFDFILQLLSTLPSLLGEELLAILPMLAVTSFLRSRTGMDDGTSLAFGIFTGWLIFCLAHLPTYDWNVAQCFGIIGTARLVFTLAFLVTRNLWVSFGAHVATDWTELIFARHFDQP
ncbi:type II CAAX prenyl endopeptidase Rce1 family protein [Paracoccus sp. KR1-242]|uniref:CPBP family glutamic-type intramembrane protease n=1 Tax=Paracoccus sp. KR1-242 TaxID=3410028 RepID=UPI003C1144F1